MHFDRRYCALFMRSRRFVFCLYDVYLEYSMIGDDVDFQAITFHSQSIDPFKRHFQGMS